MKRDLCERFSIFFGFYSFDFGFLILIFDFSSDFICDCISDVISDLIMIICYFIRDFISDLLVLFVIGNFM